MASKEGHKKDRAQTKSVSQRRFLYMPCDGYSTNKKISKGRWFMQRGGYRVCERNEKEAKIFFREKNESRRLQLQRKQSDRRS